ncbi:MAG: carboxypeptidase-like regulatory domain-containing protein, partial [Chitinophagaceae bacterium]
AETGQPLAGASLFINNTSIGTSSDADGKFAIPSVMAGELVVSFLGYETLLMPVVLKEIERKNFLLKLEKKEASLEELLIINDATRAKYLQYFKSVFLGQTEAANHSKIENIKDIYFIKPDNDPAGISARCETPLVVINKYLGYKIRFDIIDFYYNPDTHISSYFGYTSFENLQDPDKYKKRREQAYYGSSLHFFRALISDSLGNNHFTIKNIITDSTVRINGKYERASHQFSPRSHLQKDSSNENGYTFDWREELSITYKKDGKRNISHPAYVHSGLSKNAPRLLIDPFGIVLNPMHMFVSGYWSSLKVPNMLPYDYYPEKEK